MRIAIAVSDYSLSQLIRLILEDEGHEIYVFPDLADLVDWLKKEPEAPDLLFIDFMSAQVNQIDLPAMLRESKYGSVCTILISIVPPRKEHAHFWDHFLRNPFTIRQLLATIQECADKRNS